MAIDWEKCIPKGTVLVSPSGQRELFLMKYRDAVFVADMYDDTTKMISVKFFSKSFAVNEYSIIDARKSNSANVDYSLKVNSLVCGETVLIDTQGMQWLYLLQLKNDILVRRLSETDAGIQFVQAVSSDVYNKWIIKM